jgi:hypothetical protein
MAVVVCRLSFPCTFGFCHSQDMVLPVLGFFLFHDDAGCLQ